MLEYNIYNDIAKRSGGDVYLGVVGPVRTGKSTFIKNFMNLMVIPNIENDHQRQRAMDELPQSAGGKMIMTTEPKFIPNEAVEVQFEDNTTFRIRLIDCVGYIVESALGYIENEQPRMVMTPWSENPIPFSEAAEIGTKKVITEHSNIGIVITTDGSITDIEKEDYAPAEERVVNELKFLGKPFIIILNTLNPYSENADEHKIFLEEKYGVPVLPLNCMELTTEDINLIMENLLLAFPVTEIGINLPKWTDALSDDHWLKSSIRNHIIEKLNTPLRLSDIKRIIEPLSDHEHIHKLNIERLNMVDGNVSLTMTFPENLYFKVLEELTGFTINDEENLINLLKDLSVVKKQYDKVANALEEVNCKGYGIVSPSIDELSLEEPEIVKQGSRFGVRLKASAPSIHINRYKPKFLKVA